MVGADLGGAPVRCRGAGLTVGLRCHRGGCEAPICPDGVPIRLTISDGLDGPAVLGHLSRRDPLWVRIVASVETLFFLQPLNRLARKELQDASEFLCDDWAVERTGTPLVMARSLARVDRRPTSRWLMAFSAVLLLAVVAIPPVSVRPPNMIRVETSVDGAGPTDLEFLALDLKANSTADAYVLVVSEGLTEAP